MLQKAVKNIFATEKVVAKRATGGKFAIIVHYILWKNEYKYSKGKTIRSWPHKTGPTPYFPHLLRVKTSERKFLIKILPLLYAK